MHFRLTIAALGRFPELEISAERFQEIKAARHTQSNALAIEEKYEILLANYTSLERAALDISTSDMIRGRAEHYDFFEDLLALNIALVNLLTSARLYVDQLPRHVSACLHEDAATTSAEMLLEAQYDANRDYRFMEELRNHVQHKGTPVHRITLGASRTGPPPNGFLEFNLGVYTEKAILAEDKKFKKRILEECEKWIDLMTSSRSYVASLSLIQVQARELFAQPIAQARTTVETAIADYSVLSSEGIIGLEAQFLDGENLHERVQILLNWDDVRAKLQNRNRQLVNLHQRYVTGKTRPSH